MRASKVVVRRTTFHDYDPLVGDEVFSFEVHLEDAGKHLDTINVLYVVPEKRYPNDFLEAAVERAYRVYNKKKYSDGVVFKKGHETYAVWEEVVEESKST